MADLTKIGILAFLAVAACADDGTDVERGPIGKADSIGSCQGSSCAGPADSGNCFCDADCTHFGDCCADYVEECQAPTASTCGGLAGLACSSGSYCHYESDQQCGAADQLGTCVEIPGACIEIFAPVCGCDGETHSNSCFAAVAGTSVASDGECGSEQEQACGGLAGLICDEGEFCSFESDAMCGAADQLGTCQVRPEACITLFDPVCGCDDHTYGNECEANRAGVSAASQGECL